MLWAFTASAIDVDDVQIQVFTGSCALSGCHNGSTFPDLRSGQTFSTTVNQSSNQSSLLLVEPFDPDDSYLLRKIEGTGAGSRMPIGGSLSNSQIQLVRDWISEGALEDDSAVIVDSDGDGVEDSTDVCPNIANQDQADSDGDEIGDVCDICPLVADAEQTDTDNDGTGDACDDDIDNDGVLNNDDAFPLDETEWADTDNDGIGDNADSDNSTKARAYLMTTSTSANLTTLHIINSSGTPQGFTGTLYNGDGQQLGTAGVPLHNGSVSSQGRVTLTSAQLDTLFGVEPWSGPAILEVSGTAGFDLMSKLRSPSGLISNTNCVRQDVIHNLEGFDSENLTFIRLINIGDTELTDIRGTITDASGSTIGTADAQLLESLPAKGATWLNRNTLASIVGAEWDGTASLSTTIPMPNLRLLNLNFVNGETFFNFSCFESEDSGRVYLITNSASANVSETHFINTTGSAATLSGTLYAGSGDQLGNSDVALSAEIPAGGRTILSASEIENVLGTDSWSGPAMMEVSGSSDFEVMIKLTSPSGLVSNTNCVRQGAVHNIEGTDSPDRTFVRFINQGNSTISDIRGTLYDLNGTVIGNADTQLFTSLGARGQEWLNGNNFISLFGEWTGEATLVVTAADDSDLRLLNLNFVNDETFFNFSCYENSSNDGETDSASFFASEISDEVIQGICINCHVSGGQAATSALVYAPDTEQGHVTTNFNLLSDYVAADSGNANQILEKARGIDHGGGVQLQTDSDEYEDLVAFLGLLGGVIDSNNSASLGDFWRGVAVASAEETLRRATLITSGRIPTSQEITSVQSGSDDALRSAIRGILQGDGFHDFLITGANDRLFTDAFVNDSLFFEASDIFAQPFFPDAANAFFNDIPLTDEMREDKQTWVREWRWGLARAPLELIAYVVQNDRNYQEVVTADYMMVNPRTNEYLNAGAEFSETDNHREYRPGQNQGQIVRDDTLVADFDIERGINITSHGGYIDYPHAGILNTHAFLSRYPTTETNRNRARARWTYYHFLGVDIEKSASRTTDPEALADTDNPTMNNPACTVCHELHDPMAGTFQNYGNEGFYRDKEGGLDSLPATYKYPRFFDETVDPSPYQEGDTWFRDMREPGFDGSLAPTAETSLQWLGSEIASDPRFATASIKFWWPAIMGTDPLEAPADSSASDYFERLAAFEEQTSFIDNLGQEFAAGINDGSPFNARDMFVEMIMSPWFRAKETDDDSVGSGATAADIGVRRLLTPQELEAKSANLLGWAWGGDPTREDPWVYDGQWTQLEDVFGIYYGDIDSNGIRSRSRALTSLMANVAEKQAVTMACPAVVVDFSRNDAERLIFDGIDQALTPATEFTQDFDVTEESFDERARYSTSGSLNAGNKQIVISFTNDFYDEDTQDDRNLHLVGLRVHHGTGADDLLVTLNNLSDIDGATAGCGGSSGADYNLWSSCSVTIPFTADVSASYTVEVEAWAEQAGDEPAELRIAVNDLNLADGNSTGAVAIKNKLIQMHDKFLGETIDHGDIELEASYLLLAETWLDRLSMEDNGWALTYPNENCHFYLPEHWEDGGVAGQASDPNAMLYTWTSMLIYFMTDFYYLHE